MLRTLFQKLLDNAKAKEITGDLPAGTLTFETPYEQLHYGEVDGIGTVTIDKSGNMVGFSPVERCKFNGETAWIPLDLVKNLRTEPFIATGTPIGSSR
jgi:hypothetical protein